MAFPTQTIFDTCVRANESPISFGGQWLDGIASGSRTVDVVSNQAKVNSSDGRPGWVQISSSATCEFYVTFATVPTGSDEMYLFIRETSSTGSTGYAVRYFATDGKLYTQRWDAGSPTTLVGETVTLSAGGAIGVACTGTTIQHYFNTDGSLWTATTASTDATYGAAGYFSVYAVGTTGRFTNFGGGPFAPSGSGASAGSAGIPSRRLIERNIGKGFWR